MSWFLGVDWWWVPLTQGQFAMVDASDMDWVKKHKWHATASKGSGDFYARTLNHGGDPSAGRWLYMHRAIVCAGPGEVVDHQNHRTIDNRKRNLRAVSMRANLQHVNTRKKSSQYRWVSKEKRLKVWQASVHPRGGGYKRCRLGSFRNEVEAAVAANAAMSHLFPGDELNQIPASEMPMNAHEIKLAALERVIAWEKENNQ